MEPLGHMTWSLQSSSVLLLQTVTEKHKMNVPETMNEALDMSDDEGNHVTCDVIVLGLIVLGLIM